MNFPAFGAVCFLVLAGPARGLADEGANLAKGTAYTYKPPALYELTRDESDATQLTDGRLAPDTMWGSRSTVGWIGNSPTIEIEIDLGAVKRVGGVCLRSARNMEAGVHFPRRVDVFTSSERGRYSWYGNLMEGQEAREGPYLARQFCSGAFESSARYVRLLIVAKGPFFFSDEVEVTAPTAPAKPAVIADPSHQAGGGPGREARVNGDDLLAFTLEHEALSRMTADLWARPLDGPGASQYKDALSHVMDELRSNSGSLGLERLAEINQELRQAVARERAARGNAFQVRHADPWRRATPFDAAPLSISSGEIDLPQGGHGAVALAIEHARDSPLRVSMTAEAPGARGDALRVKLLHAAMVTRADGVRQSDPLPPVANGRMGIPPGESRQLWIDLSAPNDAIGQYELRVRIETKIDGQPILRVMTIPIRVWALAAPPSATPSTVVWGYLNSNPIRGHWKSAGQDMIAHGVTTAVLPATDLPWPKSAAGASDGAIGDYRHYNDVMEALKGHGQYLFFFGYNSDSVIRTFGRRHEFMSDSWRSLFTDWIKEWSSRLLRSGIGYDAFAFYPVDEPHKGVEQETLIAVARLIKAADPNIRVYTTLNRPEALSDSMIEVVDIFQLNGSALSPTIIDRLKDRDRQVWAYATAGGGKAGDPTGFYRAQGWDAFNLGLTGFGFWAYADVGGTGTAWNDIDDEEPDYAVIYEGDPEFVSSKRWEAWREGCQDFTLLTTALAKARSEEERSVVRGLAIEGRAALGDVATLARIRRRLFELVNDR